MTKPNTACTMQQLAFAPWQRHALAALLFAAALLSRFLLLPVEAGLAFLTFYPATAIAALLLGWSPGLLVTLLGTLVGPYIFMPPFWSFKFPLDQLLSAATFATSGLIVCLMAHRIQRRTAQLAQANLRIQEAMAALQAREAELEASNAELDQFAYVASHDLKAPLRAIGNLAGWVAEDLKGKIAGETVDNLDLMQRRVARLDLLLEGLLEYSRVGRGQEGIESVDLGRLVADIADYLAPRQGFKVVYAGDVVALSTHRAPLELVLRNLISNALKHHDGDSGSVVVSCREDGDRLSVRIEDDGPGIAPQYHERIFMMFQTLKSRDQVEGSGMGLAIVKKAVTQHGGNIAVESDGTRRGTAFVFTWRKENGE